MNWANYLCVGILIYFRFTAETLHFKGYLVEECLLFSIKSAKRLAGPSEVLTSWDSVTYRYEISFILARVTFRWKCCNGPTTNKIGEECSRSAYMLTRLCALLLRNYSVLWGRYTVRILWYACISRGFTLAGSFLYQLKLTCCGTLYTARSDE